MSLPASTILVVDHRAAQRSALAQILRNEGYSVTEASSRTQALELARKHPDLILLNCCLPDIDVNEACRRLKEDAASEATPILAIGGCLTDLEARAVSARHCADEYITEPVRTEDLLARIRFWTRLRKAEAELRQKNAELRRAKAQLEERFQHGIQAELERAEVEERLEAVREDADFFAKALQDSSQPFASGTPDGRLTKFNKAFIELTGYSAEELRSATWMVDLTPPEWREHERKVIEKLMATGEPQLYQKEYVRKNGSRVPIEIKVHLAKTPDMDEYYYAFVTDISERKKAEQELSTAYNKLNAMLESIADGLAVLNREWRYTYFSQVAARIVGVRTEDLLGKVIWDVFPEAKKLKFYDHFQRGMAGEPQHFEEYYPEPLNIWLELHCYPSEEGLTIYFRDITSQKRAEEELAKTARLLEAISDNTGDVIFSKDRDGRLTYANRATLRLVGKTLEKVLGYTDAELLKDKEAARKVMENDRRIMEAGRAEDIEEMVPLPDGSERVWLSRKVPYRDSNGTVIGLLGVSRDITERKRADEILMRSEKVAALGRMAASLAHDINNPLAAVMNTLYIATHSSECPDSVRQYLQIADSELKRIAHITRQALGFYREDTKPTKTQVHALLDEAVAVFRSKAKAKRIKVETQYRTTPEIIAVPGELRQVFSNLIANSIDAIGTGGIIKARVSSFRCSGHDFVRITVADDGAGIEQGAIRRVFEPLFTTKGTVGTGLGLWVSKQLIEKHGGSIRVHSSVNGENHGTSVSIILPTVPGAGMSFKFFQPSAQATAVHR